MLLTGTASALTGAPGAVMLYPLIGLAIWPRSPNQQPILAGSGPATSDDGLLSRRGLRWALSAFWFFMAFLQLQPYWWQSGHISGAIGAMAGAGGLNTAIVDPFLTALASATANLEVPLNSLLVLVFLAIGIALALPGERYVRPALIASIVISALVWYFTQAFGMIFTGVATDFNSGLLLIVIALGAWPRAEASGQEVPASSSAALEGSATQAG
jgi:hypothetical protein